MLYISSLACVALAMLVVWLVKLRLGQRLTGEQVARVGFAAAPIPIYMILPVMPIDPDLAEAVLGQPVQLAIAAAAALLWTIADVKTVAVNGATKAKAEAKAGSGL